MPIRASGVRRGLQKLRDIMQFRDDRGNGNPVGNLINDKILYENGKEWKFTAWEWEK